MTETVKLDDKNAVTTVYGTTPLEAFMEEHNETRAEFAKINNKINKFEKSYITVREYKKQINVYNDIIKSMIDIIIKLFVLSISATLLIVGCVLMHISTVKDMYEFYEIGAPMAVCSGFVAFLSVLFIIVTMVSYNKGKRKRR